jgi:hypothetical protein
MLISATLRAALLYGSIGIAVLGLGVLMMRPRWPWLMVPGLMILLGIVGAFWTKTHFDAHAVVVTGQGNALTVGRMRCPDPPDGKDVFHNTGPASYDDPVWVINESTSPVRVEVYDYGMSFATEAIAPTEIPPGSMARFPHIDLVGPTSRPPRTIMSEAPLGSRYRLTWGEDRSESRSKVEDDVEPAVDSDEP